MGPVALRIQRRPLRPHHKSRSYQKQHGQLLQALEIDVSTMFRSDYRGQSEAKELTVTATLADSDSIDILLHGRLLPQNRD